MIKKSIELGGVLTGEQLKAVEDSNDAWDDLNRAMTGTGEQIVSSLAPALEILADKLIDVIADTKSFTQRIKDMDKATGSWGARISRTIKIMLALKFMVKSTADDSRELAEAHKEFVESQNKVTEAVKESTKAQLSSISALEKAKSSRRDSITREIEKLQDEINTWGMTKDQILRQDLSLDAAFSTGKDKKRAQASLKHFDNLIALREILRKQDKDASNERKKEQKTAERVLQMAKDRLDVARKSRALMSGGVSPTVPGASGGFAGGEGRFNARVSRFLTGISLRRSQTATPESETAKNTAKMVNLLTEQKAILQEINADRINIIPEGIESAVTSRFA